MVLYLPWQEVERSCEYLARFLEARDLPSVDSLIGGDSFDLTRIRPRQKKEGIKFDELPQSYSGKASNRLGPCLAGSKVNKADD